MGRLSKYLAGKGAAGFERVNRTERRNPSRTKNFESDLLADWFIDWLTDWLIYWLTDWFVDWTPCAEKCKRRYQMRNFNGIHITPMFFKNMSSNFFRYILYSMGHIEIYPVVPFTPENRTAEKPMLRFVKILKGEILCTLPFLKTRCCVCHRFLPSFPSAEAHGGPDAKAVVFPSPSKSALAHQRGKALTFSRFWKRSPAGKRENDHRQRRFLFSFHPSAFPALSPGRTDGFMAMLFKPLRGP
jgi:hypothetical protein